MRRLRILLCTAEPDAARWHADLAGALPDAEVSRWPEGREAPDYAVVWRPPEALFAQIASPRAIFNLGAGVDALLRLRSLPPHVPVIRLEDAGMASQMAEYVTLAVLAAHRDAQGYRRRQVTGSWEIAEPRPVESFGVGLLGLGVLGQACAAALAPFGFPLSGWSRERRCIPGVATQTGRDGLGRVLAAAHVLVCVLPSTPDTRNLLDHAQLSRLPRGAHVVNVARGDLLVDEALLALLDTGHLGGATLDVFREEPLPEAHPFWHHPRITVTPHVAALTLRAESVAQVVDKIRRLERGEAVTGIVDRRRGY